MWELHHIALTAGKWVCYFIIQSFRWIQIQRERHRDRMKIWAPKVLGSNPSLTIFHAGHLGWAYITEHQFPHLRKRDNHPHDFKWANLLNVHTRLVGPINDICYFFVKSTTQIVIRFVTFLSVSLEHGSIKNVNNVSSLGLEKDVDFLLLFNSGAIKSTPCTY